MYNTPSALSTVKYECQSRTIERKTHKQSFLEAITYKSKLDILRVVRIVLATCVELCAALKKYEPIQTTRIN